MRLKFDGQELPEWLDLRLRQRNPEPTANTLIQLLLEDYIARHEPEQLPEPGSDGFFCRYPVDRRDGVLKFIMDNGVTHFPSEETQAAYEAWTMKWR